MSLSDLMDAAADPATLITAPGDLTVSFEFFPPKTEKMHENVHSLS